MCDGCLDCLANRQASKLYIYMHFLSKIHTFLYDFLVGQPTYVCNLLTIYI